MSELSKKHVQVPNDMTLKPDLEPRDLLVYATIKKYVNYKSGETFVGLETIAKDSGYTVPTVRKSINILKTKQYITVRKKGRSNLYTFNKYKNFEPFSYEFLDRTDLNANEKAYIIASQQYMFKDVEGIGKMTYSNEHQANKLNISSKTIQRLDSALIQKGFLNIVKTSAIDGATGLKINEKIFHLNELEQAVVWTLQKHDEKIEQNTEDIKTLQRQIDILLKANKEKDDILSKLQNIDLDDLKLI